MIYDLIPIEFILIPVIVDVVIESIRESISPFGVKPVYHAEFVHININDWIIIKIGLNWIELGGFTVNCSIVMDMICWVSESYYSINNNSIKYNWIIKLNKNVSFFESKIIYLIVNYGTKLSKLWFYYQCIANHNSSVLFIHENLLKILNYMGIDAYAAF